MNKRTMKNERRNLRFWCSSYFYIYYGDQAVDCVSTIDTNARVMVDAKTGILQQTRNVDDLSLIGIVTPRSCPAE